MRGVWGKGHSFHYHLISPRVNSFEKPMRSLHGKCRILNSVKQPCGETIFQLTFRFPTLEVFEKPCGTYAEVPYTQL